MTTKFGLMASGFTRTPRAGFRTRRRATSSTCTRISGSVHTRPFQEDGLEVHAQEPRISGGGVVRSIAADGATENDCFPGTNVQHRDDHEGQLRSPLIAPGYQYDIIRRRRGHLGLSLQFDLFNSNALLFAAAQVNTNNRVISAKK